jgi:hypothetical protein
VAGWLVPVAWITGALLGLALFDAVVFYRVQLIYCERPRRSRNVPPRILLRPQRRHLMIPILALLLEYGRETRSDFEVLLILIPILGAFVLWTCVNAISDIEARTGE